MKFLFICGSLEPGKNGVGDYTRRLAGECIRMGHDAMILALDERIWIEDAVISSSDSSQKWSFQDDYGTAVPCMRWPAGESWRMRGEALTRVIRQEQPDVVSIQFVPFAYDPKGLPFGFIRVMRRVARSVNVRWHAFFHELWIGRQKGKRVKSIVVAAMQRHLVRRLRFCDVVHTHLPVYKASLDRLGFNCHPLPLFSNIPCVITPPVERDGSVVEVGFFSQHAPNDVVRDWLIEFIQDAKKKGKSVRLHLAGGNQPASEKYWRASVKGLADFKAHGWMSSPDISKYLRSLDLGITTVPQHGLGKSSAIAVFAEHELPFAAPNPGFGTCGFFYSPKMLQSNVFKIDRNDVSIGRHLSLMSQNLVDS